MKSKQNVRWQAKGFQTTSRRSASPKYVAVLGVSLFWCFCILASQHILDINLSDHKLWDKIQSRSATASIPSRERGSKGYIVFMPTRAGQGAGNLMNGILAAHLLALEFDRTVCVSPTFTEFLQAFEPVEPIAIYGCANVTTQYSMQQAHDDGTLVRLINYEGPVDECKLKRVLSSSARVIHIISNTYPRWPIVPPNFFPTYYKPTAALQDILPWKEPPQVVVHLRAGDPWNDKRRGLDDNTLVKLGEALPVNTFLVTNKVAWYQFFSERFQWTNPGWGVVRHSALQDVVWGADPKKGKNVPQNLQLWSDWYTILKAKKVWHTHSDFSLSAIHWMNIDSKTIQGVDGNGKLDLWDESWRRDGETERLIDRGPENLRCHQGSLKDAYRKKFGRQI